MSVSRPIILSASRYTHDLGRSFLRVYAQCSHLTPIRHCFPMRIYTSNAITLSITLANLLIVGTADAQLRVANWNVTFYRDGRVTEFQTAIFAQAPSGIQFWPDVLIAQEILGAEGGNNFKNLLNSYTDARGPGPRDYEVAPISGVSQNALFYRTSKVSLISSVRLSSGTGTCATCPVRDNDRYLVRLAGYNSAAEPGTITARP